MRSRRNRLSRLAAGLFLIGGACASPTEQEDVPPIVSLAVVSGSGQTAPAGSELPSPLVVKVTDGKGKALAGYLVSFSVTSGGGTMYAGTGRTDGRGITQDWWRLGPLVGSQRVDVVAVDPLTGAKLNFGSFTANATAVP